MIRSALLFVLASAFGLVAFLPVVRAQDASPAQVLAPALRPFVDDHSVNSISGAVLVVTGPDKVLALETLGYSDLAAQRPMREGAMFWIASMTKPITAMAVMMCVEEGKLSIDDPVEKHLPEFRGQMLIEEQSPERVVLKKPARPITVKDLLTHTSGLTNKLPGGAPMDALTLQGAVVGYAVSPLQFEPGSKWQYCNPGINTLGRLVEVASGKSYAEFLQERLFDPLGMRDTTFWPTELQRPRIAKTYKLTPDKSLVESPGVLGVFSPNLSDHTRMALPAGGLFSTAADLAKLYQMVLSGGKLGGRQYLKPETLRQMTTNQTGDLKVSFTDGMHMGLGFHIVHEPMGVTESLSPGSFGHGGAYGTQAWIDPVKKIAVVLLIQRFGLPNSDQSDLRRKLQKAAAERFGK